MAIEIQFDPSIFSYRSLLEFFFQIHDPTTLNRQGNDRGMSYRSAIFYLSDEQKATAETLISEMNASGKWPGPVVTAVVPAAIFGMRKRNTRITCRKILTAIPAITSGLSGRWGSEL
ncbi:MAG: msrA [Ferruginibacter sp.]|nr:msrA [Ferruginibacter sp.]